MQKTYFTVGPSQIFPTLSKHINGALKLNIPSISHRGVEFKNLYKEVDSKLKKLLRVPQNYQILFTSCALEAMERTIQGVVEKNSFHLLTGSFGKSWAKYAKELGKNALTQDLQNKILSYYGQPMNELKVPKEAELICITQNDTSTGIQIPMEEIYALKKKHPKKLIALDVVSSIPYVDIDYSKIDITFFFVQKGFGLPAGLGLMIVSPQALQQTNKLTNKRITTGSYHSLKNLSEKYENWQTPETPNVLNIFLLNKILGDLLKVGIDKIRHETDQKFEILNAFFMNHKTYQNSVKNPKFQSITTPVIDVKGNTKKILEKASKKGFLIGAGYGEQKDTHIRIANFPSHKISQVRELIKAI